MRNVAVVVAIALLIPAARAANVEIARPRIVFLSDAGAAVECKAAGRRGCATLQTDFVCGCVKAAAGWGLQVRLLVTPYFFTTTPDIIFHEMRHVADVRASLDEYASSLMLHEFADAVSCTKFIIEEKAQFSLTMKNIQRLTTIRRDGVQYADR